MIRAFLRFLIGDPNPGRDLRAVQTRKHYARKYFTTLALANGDESKLPANWRRP